MSRIDYYPHYSQPTSEELRAKAAKSAKRESGKGKRLEPVIVTAGGRKIVTTWWGQAWCDNLERYADYASRIDRGKRYVRNGSVIDLKIEKGQILARVQGSRATPYKTQVQIDPLPEDRVSSILEQCGQKLASMDMLISGEFPLEMKELFTAKDGLFPSPKEIHFSCSCPDWAYMCKHVAAVLYGVGVRLDENPLLFFELRGIDVNSFIDVTLAGKVETMLANADRPSDRIIDSSELDGLFGITV